MNKKIIILSLLILIGCMSMAAQKKCSPDPKMWKEIQAFKLEFMSQEMELDKEQQKKFSLLYNEMWEKKKIIFKEIKSIESNLDNCKDATDRDYEEASARIESLRQKDYNLNKEYEKKFEKFLTKRQMYKMRTAEDKFRHRMQQMKYKGKKHRIGKDDRVKPAKK